MWVRRKFLDTYTPLGSDLALTARRWLAALAAHHLLPLYIPSRHTAMSREASIEEFGWAIEYVRYANAYEAVGLAFRVMWRLFDSAEACRIASDMHSAVGYEVPFQSLFIEMAANKALGEVSCTYDVFELHLNHHARNRPTVIGYLTRQARQQPPGHALSTPLRSILMILPRVGMGGQAIHSATPPGCTINFTLHPTSFPADNLPLKIRARCFYRPA